LCQAQALGGMGKASEMRSFEKYLHLLEGHGFPSIFGRKAQRTRPVASVICRCPSGGIEPILCDPCREISHPSVLR
jgi:hypothetical protein